MTAATTPIVSQQIGQTLFRIFNDFSEFSKQLANLVPDVEISQIIRLNRNYIREGEDSLLLSLKDNDGQPDNILFLSANQVYIFTKKRLDIRGIPKFDKVLQKSYGVATITAFLMLTMVLDSYRTHHNQLVSQYDELEQNFDEKKAGELSLNFAKLFERVEDLIDVIERVEEARIKEVVTEYISFDYSLLIAESVHLLDRLKARVDMVKNLLTIHELKIGTQLNERIEKLNDVVKRLTAITIVLMVPNIIAAHFGMNFRFMPELDIWWAYPTVIVAQIIFTLSFFFLLRKKRWI